MSKNRKTKIAILVVFILLVLSGVIFFLKRDKSSLKRGFQAYTDPNCKISFKYPSNWKISQNKLPMPTDFPPKKQVIFDSFEKNKKTSTVMAYLCFDSNEVTFLDLYPAGSSQEVSNSQEVGAVGSWKKKANFYYRTQKGQLVIFQNNGDFEVFEKILDSVN